MFSRAIQDNSKKQLYVIKTKSEMRQLTDEQLEQLACVVIDKSTYLDFKDERDNRTPKTTFRTIKYIYIIGQVNY